MLNTPTSSATVTAAISAADEQVGQDLAGDHLPGVDRRDPEQLDDAARPLPDEGERDERDGQVLEDEGEDRGPEVGEDPRLGRRDVLDLGARRGGDDLRWDHDRTGLGGRDRVAFGLLGRAADDRLVDRVRQVGGQEPGVVGAQRVDRVHADLDDRLLAGTKAGFGIGGGDDHHVDGAIHERGLGLRHVVDDRRDVQSAAGEILVGAAGRVGRPAVGGTTTTVSSGRRTPL